MEHFPDDTFSIWQNALPADIIFINTSLFLSSSQRRVPSILNGHDVTYLSLSLHEHYQW